jgi:hypothetical protein
MKRYFFKKVGLDISEELLNRILLAFLSEDMPDVAEVSSSSNASSTSVSKVAAALVGCEFCSTHTISPGGGRKASRHYSFNSFASVLVIDIASFDISAHVITGDNKLVLSKFLQHDPTLDLVQALEILISRRGTEIKNLRCGIASVCIIYEDGCHGEITLDSVKRLTEDLIASYIGQAPLIYLTPTEATAATLRYNLLNNTEGGLLSYIHMNSSLYAFCISEDNIFRCRMEKLLMKNELTASECLLNANTAEDIADVIAKIANTLDCTYSPTSYYIESDRYKFDSRYHRALRRAFALSSSPLPEMRFATSKVPLFIFGAAKETLFTLIRLHIHPSKDQKTK